MVQMMDRRQLSNVGDAEVWEVDLTDGETIRVMVSNAQRAVLGGSEPAFRSNLARALAGRNTNVPARNPRSFV